jgi:hypothetical protein
MTTDTEQVVVLSKWAFKWLKFAYDKVVVGSDVHQCANKLLQELDACVDDPLDHVEKHEATFTKTVEDKDGKKTVVNQVRSSTKLKKGNRSKFAMSLAKEAYLKFGARPLNDANVLVTRKWLTKFLESDQYKDLRTADRVLAIDRAIFMSFVPTMVYNNMKVVMEDNAMVGRLNGSTTSFGKIFSLGGVSSK